MLVTTIVDAHDASKSLSTAVVPCEAFPVVVSCASTDYQQTNSVSLTCVHSTYRYRSLLLAAPSYVVYTT